MKNFSGGEIKALQYQLHTEMGKSPLANGVRPPFSFTQSYLVGEGAMMDIKWEFKSVQWLLTCKEERGHGQGCLRAHGS